MKSRRKIYIPLIVVLTQKIFEVRVVVKIISFGEKTVYVDLFLDEVFQIAGKTTFGGVFIVVSEVVYNLIVGQVGPVGICGFESPF